VPLEGLTRVGAEASTQTRRKRVRTRFSSLQARFQPVCDSSFSNAPGRRQSVSIPPLTASAKSPGN